MMNSFASAISFGTLLIKYTYAETSFSISIVAQKEFPVNDFYTAKLEVSITYTINYTDPDTPPEAVPVPDISPAWEAYGILFILGVSIFFLALISSRGVISEILKKIIDAISAVLAGLA